MPTLTLAIQPFATGSPQASRRTLLDLARAVDEAGVDRILVVDHVVMAEETASYPWGPFPATADTPWPEPTISLAAVAAVTERVRLATGILIAPLRPAALLAKTIATLDVISGGRVDLGVGTGWQEGEFEAVGVPFRRRGRLPSTKTSARFPDSMGTTRYEAANQQSVGPRIVRVRLPRRGQPRAGHQFQRQGRVSYLEYGLASV